MFQSASQSIQTGVMPRAVCVCVLCAGLGCWGANPPTVTGASARLWRRFFPAHTEIWVAGVASAHTTNHTHTHTTKTKEAVNFLNTAGRKLGTRKYGVCVCVTQSMMASALRTVRSTSLRTTYTTYKVSEYNMTREQGAINMQCNPSTTSCRRTCGEIQLAVSSEQLAMSNDAPSPHVCMYVCVCVCVCVCTQATRAALRTTSAGQSRQEVTLI